MHENNRVLHSIYNFRAHEFVSKIYPRLVTFRQSSSQSSTGFMIEASVSLIGCSNQTKFCTLYQARVMSQLKKRTICENEGVFKNRLLPVRDFSTLSFFPSSKSSPGLKWKAWCQNTPGLLYLQRVFPSLYRISLFLIPFSFRSHNIQPVSISSSSWGFTEDAVFAN